jgi:hypothetical protein
MNAKILYQQLFPPCRTHSAPVPHFSFHPTAVPSLTIRRRTPPPPPPVATARHRPRPPPPVVPYVNARAAVRSPSGHVPSGLTPRLSRPTGVDATPEPMFQTTDVDHRASTLSWPPCSFVEFFLSLLWIYFEYGQIWMKFEIQLTRFDYVRMKLTKFDYVTIKFTKYEIHFD